MNRAILRWALISPFLLAAACGGGDGGTEPTPTPASFSLSVTPAALNVQQGAPAQATISVSRTGSFTAAVNLTLEGAPAGLTGVFEPVIVSGASSVLTLTATAAATAGTYSLTIRGTAGGQSDKTTTLAVTVLPSPTGSFTLALSPAALSIAQGQSAPSTVSITRTGGFAGSVTLALEGTPTGVTGSFTPNPATASSSVLTVTVAAATAPGVYSLTVRGSTPSPSAAEPAVELAADQTVSLALTVTVAGSFTLSASPAALSITPGGSSSSTININRTSGFTGSVALSSTTTAPSGVTITFTPASTTGNSSAMGVTVGNGVAAGTYTITVKGNTTGLPEQTTTVQLTVAAPGGSGNVTFDFCQASGLPVWFAFQDGSGSWAPVTAGTGDTYRFTITTRGGVAWVVITAGQAELSILYGSLAELQEMGSSQCGGNGTTKTINGSVANVSAAEMAFVALDGSAAMVDPAKAPFPNFTLTEVSDGTVDLLAGRASYFPAVALNKVIIRRGLNPPAGSTLPVLDFNAAEAIAPVSRNLTVQNGGGNLLSTSVGYLTQNSTGGVLYVDPFGASSYYGIPTSQQQTGDLHLLFVTALEDMTGTTMRMVSTFFKDAVDKTISLGVTPPGMTVTATTTPYVRPRMQFSIPSDYNRYWHVGYAQAGVGQNTVTLEVWEGYQNGTTFDFTVPDFSSVAGWNNTWGLQTGSAIEWTASLAGWVTGGLPGEVPEVEGSVVRTGSRTGTFLP